MCDLYLWLAGRFPHEFDDVSSAESCSKVAQALIGEGIRIMGVAALREGQKSRRRVDLKGRGHGTRRYSNGKRVNSRKSTNVRR